MLKQLAIAIITLGISVGTFMPAWAEGGVSPEKIKAYAALYPDYFVTQPIQNVSYSVADQKRAAQLLVNSFNGNTDEAAISAVLRPQDRSPLKPRIEIEKLLAKGNLSWDDYQAITQTLAKDPQAFSMFQANLDADRVKQDLLARAQTDPEFVRQIRSVDHQIILRNLLSKGSQKRLSEKVTLDNP